MLFISSTCSAPRLPINNTARSRRTKTRSESLQKENEEEKKRSQAATLLPPSNPSPLTNNPLMPSAPPTGEQWHHAHAKRRTKTLPDPWSTGAFREAILGVVAAAPKMAGLAHEVSCIMVLCWVPAMRVVEGEGLECI